VHALPSPQAVPLGAKPSTGHAGALPVQLSARSHVPTAARHWVPAVVNPSVGQADAEPVQFSATSQSPPLARQTTDDGW
jgi:hypothetical protein